MLKFWIVCGKWFLFKWVLIMLIVLLRFGSLIKCVLVRI